MAVTTIGLALAVWVTLTSCHPYYQLQIPNGNNVQHPCDPTQFWPGVGHQNAAGGGDRNPFGLAFASAGHKWTTDLCRMDSDGDGKTNGQELGDPDCSWTSGTAPSRTSNITHPGICDPVNSQQCMGKNSFLTCKQNTFNCSLVNGSDVSSLELKFPRFQVPPTDTNYMCVTFDLPDDQDYHIIANQPILDNTKIVHHMLLFGCNDYDIQETTPTSCGMGAVGTCTDIIAMWAVGHAGSCYDYNAGFRIGKMGYKHVRLQIHYNNPMAVSDYTDTSGLRLFFRPVQQGDQDLGVFMTGQLLLQLPPGQSRIEQSAVCPGSCLRTLITQKAYIASVGNHMHYLGASMWTELYRNNTKIANLSYDQQYSYDSPVEHLHKPAIELLPGDEIRTTCVYNTLTSNRYVFFGESTSDEMCYAFITLYPRDAISSPDCESFGNSTECDRRMGTPMDGCDWANIYNMSIPENALIFNGVRKNCSLDGFCRPECRTMLQGLKSHPCFQGQANQWVTNMLSSSVNGLDFLARLHSCPMTDVCSNEPSGGGAGGNKQDGGEAGANKQDGGGDSATGLVAPSLLLLLLLSSSALH